MGHKTAVCHLWPGLVMGVFCLPACVEPNSGSNVQFDLAEGVQIATRPGATPEAEQPPTDTYYALWAADYVYIDVDGVPGPDLDMNNEPLVDRAFLFEVQRFEVRPVIDRGSPCFIDIEGAPFPGIHVTQHGAKMREVKGVTNPFDPQVPYNDAVDVLTADRRMELLPRLEGELKAVTSTSTYRYPTTTAAGECGGAVNGIPHPTCMDDESNALRLRLCQEQWEAAGTDHYEGSDKVFTLPLNGLFYGMVEGMNPINDGFVGGAGVYVDENLVGFDGFVVNWQYKDLNGDGAPDAPAGMESVTGFPYISGPSERITRGVISATLRNPNVTQIRGELAVFPNLADDDVNF